MRFSNTLLYETFLGWQVRCRTELVVQDCLHAKVLTLLGACAALHYACGKHSELVCHQQSVGTRRCRYLSATCGSQLPLTSGEGAVLLKRNACCAVQGVLVEASPLAHEHLVINRPNAVQASLQYGQIWS